MSFAQKWDRFWFTPTPTESLGLFRIYYGIVVVMKMIGLYGIWNYQNISLRFPKHRGDAFHFTRSAELFHDPMPGFA